MKMCIYFMHKFFFYVLYYNSTYIYICYKTYYIFIYNIYNFIYFIVILLYVYKRCEQNVMFSSLGSIHYAILYQYIIYNI